MGHESITDTLKNTCYTMIPLFVWLGVACAARRQTQLSCDVLRLLRLQQGSIIEQKVQRCSAEFQCEALKASVYGNGAQDTVSSYLDASIASADCANAGQKSHIHKPQSTKAVASLRSAPAVMMRSKRSQLQSFMPACKDAGNDCLPADSVVWMQDQAIPVSLSDAKAGDYVLCYDHIGQGPRYCEVADVSVETDVAPWVNVELEDGSSLVMTASHPCQQGIGCGNCVPAGQLTPGQHSMMVLKMVPMKVKSVVQHVARHVDSELEDIRTRVALTLNQPARYSVFVAASGQLPSMAVASNDAGVGQVEVRNTFLEMGHPEQRELRRCNSAPGSLHGAPCPPHEVPVPGGSSGSCSSPGNNPNSSSGSSGLASGSSHSTVSNPDVSGPIIQVSDGAGDSPPRMSDILKVRAAGEQTIGQVGHKGGNCKPCRFDGDFKRGNCPPCRSATLCNFCHGKHTEVSKRNLRRGICGPNAFALGKQRRTHLTEAEKKHETPS